MVARKRRRIYCCGCRDHVSARLTTGAEVYPHRKRFRDVPAWKCDRCKNHVGCHSGTRKPLGNIATAEIRKARTQIHGVLDPIWKSGRMSRAVLYCRISSKLGYQYHTAEISTIEEARRVWRVIMEIANGDSDD